MERGMIQIYTGQGHGKSAAALGRAVQTACEGKNVAIINFLKRTRDDEFFKRLEPEIKIFRFEKSEEEFDLLSEERQQEEIFNIKNGLNFAKKVLSTGECNLVILDEVLGLVDNGIITTEDLKKIVEAKDEEVNLIMTGIRLQDDICELADEVSQIEALNYRIYNA